MSEDQSQGGLMYVPAHFAAEHAEVRELLQHHGQPTW